MSCCQTDISLPTYGLIALLFVGREVVGLEQTLLLGFGVVIAGVLLSIGLALLGSLRTRTQRMPPKRVGLGC